MDLIIPLEALSRDSPDEAARVLKLGPKSVGELANNVFRDAPVMAAIDRYTGVLYSATDASNWTAEQRYWAKAHVFIHSALFGIISSGDEIPAYRLSHDTRLGGLPLGRYWAGQPIVALSEMAAGDWVLDARSEGYRDLAPIPDAVTSRYLEVVSADGGKALNHFNKIHKGRLVSLLVAAMPDLPTPETFVEWATENSMVARLEEARLVLVV
jgi:cytoplasmic iron level regulating protein YaaA (DUF328/UPF0246 family)